MRVRSSSLPFAPICLCHLLKFIDYQIPTLSFEIVTRTFSIYLTTFLQTAVYNEVFAKIYPIILPTIVFRIPL